MISPGNVCPIKTSKIRTKNDPWITNEIIEQLIDKDRAWLHAKDTDLEEDHEYARMLRNRIKNTIRRAKRSYIQENDQRDQSKFWKKMTYLLPKKCMTQNITLLDENTNNPLSPQEASNYANEYFSTIGYKLAQKFKDPWRSYDYRNPPKMNRLVTNENDLRNIVKQIDPNKSSAIPNLSSKILKDAFLAIIPQLVYMYNLSFDSCIFPNAWKRSTVIPVFKTGEVNKINNYRPISLLPLPGKIAERIVHTAIYEHIELHDLLNKFQGGFRKNHSTISTIADLIDDLATNINNRDHSMAIFIDFSKAFDTVNHTILIKKLKYFGLPQKTYYL